MIEADLVVHGIGQLVTCEATQGEGSLGLLESAAVAARHGDIVWVGPSGRWQWRIDLVDGAQVIDAEGRCVLPGFVDARANLFWTGSRADEHAARLRGQPFWGGGIMRSVRLTRSVDFEDLLATGRRRLHSFLRHGITAVEARSGYGLTIDSEEVLLRAAHVLGEESPARVVPTFMGLHVVPDGVSTEAYLEQVDEEMLPRFRALSAFFEAWCDPGAFTVDQCRRMLRRALGLGYQIKLAAAQVAPGDGPRLAAELLTTTVEQVNYLRDGDARTLAESPVVCVICPASTLNLRLASEGAARALAAAGCQLAIATDFNPGTAASENMCLMIGIACLELGVSPEQAVRAATLGGARALRVQRHCGSVRMGKRCDLLLLDAETYLDIPYRLGVNLVETTICQGQVISGEAPAFTRARVTADTAD